MAGLGIQKRGTGIARVQRAKGGMSQGQKKISKVMKEFKSGELHSGKKGPVVKSRKQAIAIALSEAGKSKTQRKKFGKGSILKGMKKPAKSGKSGKVIMKYPEDFKTTSMRQSELIKKFNDKTITPKESQELESLEISNILP